MDERALIYSNLLNGISPPQLAHVFHKTESEIMEIFRYISRKIKVYLFLRCKPPIFCDLLSDARRNKHQLLQVLAKFKNLDREEIFSNVQNEVVKGDPNEIAQAFNDLRGRA